MRKWSGIRKKLEDVYLAESLRGRIQYYVTTYKKSPDHEGRAAIRFDGKEIIKGCYYSNWNKAHMFPRDENYEVRRKKPFSFMDDDAVKLGAFDQQCFYNAFEEFDNQSIEKSLESDNMIIRIFAILDKRIGKRRLAAMQENIENEPETIQMFYSIRVNAENLMQTENNE